MAGKCSRLKALVAEVEGTIKETMEFVDKLQANLDAALTYNLDLENQAKSTKDQVALLQHQVVELQAQAKGARATSTRLVELEAKLKEIVAQGGEIFI